jgi:hypothetical protein
MAKARLVDQLSDSIAVSTVAQPDLRINHVNKAAVANARRERRNLSTGRRVCPASSHGPTGVRPVRPFLEMLEKLGFVWPNPTACQNWPSNYVAETRT